jgi:hypothetical protein
LSRPANFDITDHAVNRFRDRVRDVAYDKARDEIGYCLEAADERQWRRVKAKKRTAFVRTGCCILVFQGFTVVTCLKEFADKQEGSDGNHTG